MTIMTASEWKKIADEICAGKLDYKETYPPRARPIKKVKRTNKFKRVY